MLIILSGVETIHKKFFARQILAALNTFEVDGYTVTFKDHVPTVVDKDGTVVYQPAMDGNPGINHLLVDLDNDGVYDEAGNATFEKIQALNDRVFLSGVRDNHFAFIFATIPYDFEVTSQVEFDIPDGYLHPHTYEDVLNNYRNRECENFVITGIFGKGFINKIREDLGNENVTVINIVRNPSVCRLIHEKPEAYYIKNDTYTKEFNENKLSVSICQAASLARFSDITTLRFEDLLRDGKFTVLGKEVEIPFGYIAYNQWLTTWEMSEVVSLGLCTPAELNEFNEMYHHLAASLNEDPRLPQDLFAMLDYDPLTYEEIVDNGQPK